MTARTGEEPLVTVIVPAWNAERTLRETLRSVAAQTYRKLELIIVDDGSTDGTAAVAEEFCRLEPRARLVRKNNGGVASARNRGIAEANGEWIAPIDADDVWHPTRTEKMLAAALAAPEKPGLVYCWFRAIDVHNRVITSGPRWAFSGPAFRRFAYINPVGGGSGLLLSAEAVRHVGGYDETLRVRNAQGCEDIMIQLRVALNFPVAVSPEHLVGWRHHESNMSGDFDQIVRSYRCVFDDLLAEGAPIPPEVVGWADGRCAFDTAENRAVAGERLSVVRWLADAVRLDPAWSSSMIGSRLVRSIWRRTKRVRSRPRAAYFAVDPAAEIRTDPYEIRSLSSLVAGVEALRLKRLERADREASAREHSRKLRPRPVSDPDPR